MKKIINMTFLLSFIILFGFMGLANAQRVVPIAPTAFGIINDTIEGDTLANGDRVDPNTIYELERGLDKYYVFNGTLTNVGYHLHIRAEAGEGPRPKLVPGLLEGGISVGLFIPRGDLTLEGLYMTHQNTSNAYDAIHIISMAAEDINLHVDDCLFHGDASTHVETDAQNQSVFITNSILSYSFNNGRSLDRRGNKLDSMVVQNSTLVNIGSDPLRWGGDGYANYIKFDHVTWCVTGESIAQLGETVDIIFTNNLLINVGYKGTEDDGSPSQLFRARPLTSPDLSGLTQSITFRNNNLWLDPQIVTAYGNLDVSSGTNSNNIRTRIFGDSLTHTIIDSSSFISDPVTFTNGPSTDTLFAALKQIWEELDGDRDGGTIFDTGPEGVNIYGDPLFGIFPFDLSYNTEATSYTAADNGLPLGDLNWFPDKKAEWELTSIEPEPIVGSPSEFRLSQNYPNPFNPATNITYNLARKTDVTLLIYNTVGQKIATLVDKEQTAGSKTVTWNGTDDNGTLLSSGIYFYQLKAGEFNQTKKMLYLK
jgi:hypothetical protein